MHRAVTKVLDAELGHGNTAVEKRADAHFRSPGGSG